MKILKEESNVDLVYKLFREEIFRKLGLKKIRLLMTGRMYKRERTRLKTSTTKPQLNEFQIMNFLMKK